MALLQTARRRTTDRTCLASFTIERPCTMEPNVIEAIEVGCDLGIHGEGLHWDKSAGPEGLWWWRAMADA